MHWENIVLYVMSMGAPAVFLTVVMAVFIKTKSNERKIALEKGIALPPFRLYELLNKTALFNIGMLLVAIALGLLSGIILENYLAEFLDDYEGVMLGVMVFIFSGISLMISKKADK